jgi:hypothetical protein
MASFATVSDLATHLKGDLSAEDTATATQALEFATAAIKSYVGQELEAVDNRVQVFRANRCISTLMVDELPVRAVDSITVDTVAFTDFDVDLSTGIIIRNDYFGLTPWNAFEKIVVTYDSGFTVIPSTLKMICAHVAAREMVAPTHFASETIGNYSRALESDSAGAFTKAERALLHRFRP